MDYNYFIEHSSNSLYSKQTQLQAVTNDFYVFLIVIGIFLLVCMFIKALMQYVIPNQEKRKEAKEHLGRVMIGGFLLGGIVYILDVILRFGMAL